MALPVSAQIQKQKQKKFEKQIINLLSKFPANFLKEQLKTAFLGEHTPNAKEFVKMVSSAKYGGENYWVSGGQGFKAILQIVNHIWPKFQSNLDMFEDDDDIGFNFIQPTFIGYLLHYVHFFPKLRKYVETINPDDFRRAGEIYPSLFLEKDSNAYGFLLLPYPTVSAKEAEQVIERGQLWNDEIIWKTKGFPNWSPNSAFSTGSLEYITPFVFYFGTLDELVDVIPNREKHDVSPYFRGIETGNPVSVRGSRRRNPIRSKVITDDITNKIVYRVYDHQENLRYIGEGKPDRHLHVNSGASHNVKINEHFFLHGEMKVEIIKEGLSKVEALAFEKMLLNQASGRGLWNKKDYEPFEDFSMKGFTDEEVRDYALQKDED